MQKKLYFPLSGSIQPYETKSGTGYRAIINIPTENGRKQKSKSYHESKHENPIDRCKMWLYEMNRKIGNGQAKKETDVNFNDFLAEWFQSTCEDIRSGTVDKRERALKNHIYPWFKNRKIKKISSFDIKKFYKDKLEVLAPGSVNVLADVINIALKHAEKNDYINSNPAENVSPPPHDPDMTVYDHDQIARFLKAVRRYEAEHATRVWYSHYPIFYTALNTGLRPGEVLGLRMQDLNMDEDYLNIEKSLKKDDGLYLGKLKTKSSYRTVKLTDENKFVIQEQLKQRERMKENADEWAGANTLFVTTKGKMMWPSTLRRKLNKILETTNIPDITMHEFRHTHATMLLRSGVPIYNVSKRLGHSSTDITESTYVQYVPSMQKETINKYQKSLDF